MSERWSQLGANLWGEATAIAGTLAEVYLNHRGIRLAPWPAALRFHPAADHPKLKQKFPALIAQVNGAAEDSFQFTYLSADGKGKAAIDKQDQRRTLGSNKGGVVLLTDDIQPGATLAVGEGVESVASAMQASGLAGIAVLGIGGLANIEFSPDVVEIVLLAENDDASRKAIDKAAPSLVEKGIRVRAAQPPQGFGDFNDLIDPSKEGGGPGGLVIAKIIIEAAPEWRPKRGKTEKSAAPKQASQASFLVDLATSRCDLFCDPTGEAYASFVAAHATDEHQETHRLRSKSFNLWLRLLFYTERNSAPSSEAMATAIKTLMAKAHFDGDRRDVHLRTASTDGKIYLDLCDPQWRAIEIDADGFRIADELPVHFRREAGMLALPAPSKIVPKNGIERLREVLRLRDNRDFVIIAAWLLAALAGRSPYAVMIFLGEPGATKTSAAYAVRSIIDPNASPLRTKPKDPHDVFVAATHSLIVGYNNLSSLPDWLSDTICVVSEGSGESRRELFTDSDESLIIACAPFLLTGIENVVKRGDLAQRTLYVHLASVPDGERLTEQTFKARFRRVHADLLGALCAAASVGLRNEKTLKLDSLPRLASFFHWASACEPALWRRGDFRRAFSANAKDATEDVIEGEQAASVFRRFMAERGKWEGTATELLADLVVFVRRPVREAESAHAQAVKDRDDVAKEKTAAALREARETARDILGDGWPKAPNALTGKLKRASPALRNAGVRIDWPTRHGDARMIKIATTAPKSRRQRSSQSSSSSGQPNNLNALDHNSKDGPGPNEDDLARLEDDPGGDGPTEGRTIAGRSLSEGPSSHIPLSSKGNFPSETREDDRDDLSPSLSDANGSIAARIVSDFDKVGFRIALAHDSSLAIHDLAGSRQRPRSPPPQLMAEFTEHADAIACWLERGGTI
jgi:hypothetical protein